jgi:hypothetical protein
VQELEQKVNKEEPTIEIRLKNMGQTNGAEIKGIASKLIQALTAETGIRDENTKTPLLLSTKENGRNTQSTTVTTPPEVTTTAEINAELFLIGPGSSSSGHSEVLSLPSLTREDCFLPVFPHGDYQGYVSTLTEDGLKLCGGYHSSKQQSDCYLLSTSGQWLGTPPMKTRRFAPAAVHFKGGWWVTGGYSGKKTLDTTELWQNQAWQDHIKLPETLYGHCMVSINKTHVLLSGGYNGKTGQRTTYLYSEYRGFVKQENMLSARRYHGCYLVEDDLVVVAGGAGASKKSEFFNLSTMSWAAGPDLPTDAGGPELLTVSGRTLLLGAGKKILELEPLKSLSTVKWWRWTELGEMKHARQYFGAFPISKQFCN